MYSQGMMKIDVKKEGIQKKVSFDLLIMAKQLKTF